MGTLDPKESNCFNTSCQFEPSQGFTHQVFRFFKFQRMLEKRSCFTDYMEAEFLLYFEQESLRKLDSSRKKYGTLMHSFRMNVHKRNLNSREARTFDSEARETAKKEGNSTCEFD